MVYIYNHGFLISYLKFYCIYDGDRIKTFFLLLFLLLSLPPFFSSFPLLHNTESISTCQYFDTGKYVTTTFMNSGQCPLPSVALFSDLSQLIALFLQ